MGVVPAAGRRTACSDARGRAHAARLSVLARLQLGLEALYRVETRLAIDAFVIDERGARRRPASARAPREQLLVRQDDGELAMALFVDAAALENLERHDPAAAWTTTQLRRLLPGASRA